MALSRFCKTCQAETAHHQCETGDEGCLHCDVCGDMALTPLNDRAREILAGFRARAAKLQETGGVSAPDCAYCADVAHGIDEDGECTCGDCTPVAEPLPRVIEISRESEPS